MAADKAAVSEKVQQFMRKGQWDRALDEMKKLHAENGSDPMITLRLGDIYLKAGDTKNAAESYHSTAELFEKQGHASKAIATYKMVLRIAPGYDGVEKRIDRLAEEKSSYTRFRPARQEQIQAVAAPPADEPCIELSDTPASGQMVIEREPEAPWGHVEDAVQRLAPETGVDLDEGLVGGSGLELTGGGLDAEDSSGMSYQDMPDEEEQIPLFSELPREELHELLAGMTLRTYQEGDTIVSEGEEGDALYIIRNGAARVVTHVKGAYVNLAELGERDFFGEVSFLTGRPRTADIVAVTPAEILELPGGELRRVMEAYPAIEGVLRMFHENRVSETISSLKAVPKDLFS